MSAEQIIGVLILVAIFALLLQYCAEQVGWKESLKQLGFAMAVVALVFVAISLIAGGNS